MAEESVVVSVRLPKILVERLYRYLDLAETRTGLKSNRAEAIRQSLTSWLDVREQELK